MDSMDDLALNLNLLPRSVTENTLAGVSAEGPCIEVEILGKKNNHVSQRYPSSLELIHTSGVCYGYRNGQNREGISVELKKVDFCSPDLTSAKPLRNCNVPEQTNSCVHLKRNKWDFDIAIGTCNSSLDGSVVKHGQLHGLDLGGTKERNESCPVKRLTRVFNGIDMKLEEFMGSKSDFYCKLDSDVHLDLQLKQPHHREIRLDWVVAGDAGSSVEPNSIREMTQLSLAPTLNLEEVQSEPCKDRSKRMILDLNSDPVSGAEEPTETGERMVLDLNSVPVGNDDGTLHIQPEMCFDSNIEMNVDKAADECGDLASISLIPLVSVQAQHGDMTHDCFVPQYSNQVTTEASSDLAAALSAGCVVSDCGEPRISDHKPAIIAETCSVVDESNLSKSIAEGLHVELFGISKPDESDGVEIDMSIDSLEQDVCDKKNESSRFYEAFSTRDVALENSGDDGCPDNVKIESQHNYRDAHRVVDSEIEIFAQTGSVGDDYNMSKSTSEHAHVELSGISKTAENEVLENDMSMNSLVQEVCDKKHDSDNSHEVVSARYVALEKKGDDDSLEEGEVGDSMQLLGHVDRPFEQVKQVRSDENRCVADHTAVSTVMLSHEAKVLQLQNSRELKNRLGSNRYNQHFCIERSYRGNEQSLNVHKSYIARSPPTGFSENRNIKTTLKTKSNHFLNKTNENDSAQKKFYKRENGRKIPERSLDGIYIQRENTIEPDLQPPKQIVASKTGSSSFGQATEYASGRNWHGPYSKKDSAPNRLWSTKKHGDTILKKLSNDERKRVSGKSFKRDKQSHAGRRDKRCFSESQCERSRGKFVGEYGTDSTLHRKAKNKFGALQSDPNSIPNNVLELPDNSITNWSPWPESAHEVGNAGTSDNQFGFSDSVARVSPITGEHQLSQFPPNTSSHEAREGKITAGRQVAENLSGNIISNRWAMREASECRQSTGQNLMRDFPDAMLDTSGSTRIWGERNLSPIQSQLPMHLGDAGRESSLRSRQGSLHQRFSPNRWTVSEVSGCHESQEHNLMRDFRDVSFDPFIGAQPRIHYRHAVGTHIQTERSLSPIHQGRPPTHLGDDTRQIFLRSQDGSMHRQFPSRRRGRPYHCKAGENSHSVTMERKRGISPVSRFRAASRNGCPSRPVRGSLRNNHAAVEEHFGPTNDDFCELAVGAEYADSSYDERRKLVRAHGQHLDGSTDNEVTHPDNVEDTHPTRLSMRVDDECLNGGFPSNRHRSIKSRLGSTPGRWRGTEMQEENYGYHRREGWHHANLNNGWKKRRKFNHA